MNPEFPPPPFSPTDLDDLPTPTRTSHHRRSHSETLSRFPDDLLFDVSDLDLSSLDLPAPTEESSGENNKPPPQISHFRSFSVDADFFEGLSFAAPKQDDPARMGLHRRNSSMDGSCSSFEGDSLLDGVKKTLPPEKLAELALIDPKRAKRILANRQSAARSKERKIRYTGELERKVQTLQTEATTLSAQVTLLQRDTSGLTTENRELKLRLQAMEQQAQLRDALNEALRDEVQRLRIATGQIPATHRGSNSFGGHQTQHPQFQNSVNHARSSFMDFNHRV